MGCYGPQLCLSLIKNTDKHDWYWTSQLENYAHLCICLSDVMQYDEMEYDDESEPEIPIYNRAELIERYQVIYCCAQTFLTCLLFL